MKMSDFIKGEENREEYKNRKKKRVRYRACKDTKGSFGFVNYRREKK